MKLRAGKSSQLLKRLAILVSSYKKNVDLISILLGFFSFFFFDNQPDTKIFPWLTTFLEASTGSVLLKKVFFKISNILQESASDGVSF